MRMCRFHLDSTHAFQPFRIGKRNSRNPSTVPARINPYHKFSLPEIIIILLIKPAHYYHCFGVIQIRIDNTESFRQFAYII